MQCIDIEHWHMSRCIFKTEVTHMGLPICKRAIPTICNCPYTSQPGALRHQQLHRGRFAPHSWLATQWGSCSGFSLPNVAASCLLDEAALLRVSFWHRVAILVDWSIAYSRLSDGGKEGNNRGNWGDSGGSAGGLGKREGWWWSPPPPQYHAPVSPGSLFIAALLFFFPPSLSLEKANWANTSLSPGNFAGGQPLREPRSWVNFHGCEPHLRMFVVQQKFQLLLRLFTFNKPKTTDDNNNPCRFVLRVPLPPCTPFQCSMQPPIPSFIHYSFFYPTKSSIWSCLLSPDFETGKDLFSICRWIDFLIYRTTRISAAALTTFSIIRVRRLFEGGTYLNSNWFLTNKWKKDRKM